MSPGIEPPAAARESLARVQELGILSPTLADRLIQTVGVRNRLVHQYDRIDSARVHAGLRSFLRRAKEFAVVTEAWLSQRE